MAISFNVVAFNMGHVMRIFFERIVLKRKWSSAYILGVLVI